MTTDLVTKALVPPALSEVARFWSNTDVGWPNECWEWRAGLDSQGYASVKWRGHQVHASRIAYSFAFPEVDLDGLWVCHDCDNPKCVNPGHLFLGVAIDNTADMMAKGRHRNGGREAQALAAAARHRRAVEVRFPALLAAVAARLAAGEPVTYRSIAKLDGYWSARKTLGLSHRQIVQQAGEVQ